MVRGREVGGAARRSEEGCGEREKDLDRGGATDWETFKAYVEKLPEGKGGAGTLRYEMYKHAGEEELKAWYEKVVIPVIRGEWQPEKLLKEADLALVYKKGDGTSLEHCRGIGLLSHAFKILEWAILSSVWEKIIGCLDHDGFGYVHNSSARRCGG